MESVHLRCEAEIKKTKTFRCFLVQVSVPIVTSLTFDSFQAWEGMMSSLYAGMALSSLFVQARLRLNSR